MMKIHQDTYCIQVEVLPGGALPFKKNVKDAGFDLIATDNIILHPGQIIKHPLNIRFKLPRESWGRVETKSGLGAEGMLVYAGVIDEEYRGVPHVIMTNLNPPFEEYNKLVEQINDEDALYKRALRASTKGPIIVKKGDKLAQLTMNPHSTNYYIEQVETVDTNTTRGEDGFGSTGR